MTSIHLLRTLVSACLVSMSLFSAVAAAPNLASQLQPFVDRHELAGAVALVATGDRVLSLDAVGFAEVSSGARMKSDTLFWIASQTKPMTAVALLMLVDAGQVSLDDAVEKYLPEFRDQKLAVDQGNGQVLLKKPSHPITVREVLSHTSGLPFQSALEAPTLDGLPLAAAVRSYAMTPLQSEPGTRYQYSNAGINTAARMVEVVTRIRYEDFMQQRLFGPLGMNDTTFWPTPAQVRRIAKSYRPNAAKTGLEEFPIGQLIYPLSDRVHRFPMPAGGLFSTASDTATFCQMLLNRGVHRGKRILSEASFVEMTRRQTPVAWRESYGLGLSVDAGGFGHGGAHSTGMDIRMQDGLVLVWMVQHAGFPGRGGDAQGVFKRWAVEQFKK